MGTLFDETIYNPLFLREFENSVLKKATVDLLIFSPRVSNTPSDYFTSENV